MNSNSDVRIGSRKIGDGEPCFITYEAGPTHSGLDSAKRLIKHAADAGADAVKFQILNPARLVADREMLFSYDILVDRQTDARESVSEPLYDILQRRTLARDEWRELKAYSDDLGLAFFSTVTFEDEIELLEELGCHSIKIASGDVNHVPLLRRAARTRMCLQLDTGSSTIGEIEKAVDIILAEGNDQIIIHHCPSGYPARIEGINLNVIRTLKHMFPFPIAFSDHCPGWEMDVAAVALGANLVEKTITEDRTTRSVEHIMSIEPDMMRSFIETIRGVEGALGSDRRIMSEEELSKRKIARRSIHVKQDLPIGHVVGEDDLDYRRPAGGIPPDAFEEVIGMRLTRSKGAEERLVWGDLTDPHEKDAG